LAQDLDDFVAALAVMPKRSVPKVSQMSLALVEPVMDRQVILWFAPE
jgi:hypothetical protein